MSLFCPFFALTSSSSAVLLSLTSKGDLNIASLQIPTVVSYSTYSRVSMHLKGRTHCHTGFLQKNKHRLPFDVTSDRGSDWKTHFLWTPFLRDRTKTSFYWSNKNTVLFTTFGAAIDTALYIGHMIKQECFVFENIFIEGLAEGAVVCWIVLWAI